MNTTYAALVTAAGLVLLSAQSQTTAPPLEFEVASVKPAKSVNGVRGGCHGIDSKYAATQIMVPLGRCVVADARLSHLINIAYDVRSMGLIKSGPDWIARGDERFNVEAKAEDPASTSEQKLREMLQTLLVDRFKLKFHRETVEMAGSAITIAKTGPKLKESSAEEVGTAFGGESPGKPMPGRPVSLNARKYSMPMLASLLSQINGPGPVIDKTGLQGDYDFVLSWDEQAGPALSTALREQLGLRLESQKVPVSLFVVDSATKPTEN